MSRRTYRIGNYAMPTTAFPTPVTTGTSIKTMLQVKPASSISVIGWGYSFDIAPTAVVKVELLTTGTVNATVTASVAADAAKYDDPSAGVSTVTFATSGTGYTSSAEGSVTTTRELDVRQAWEQSYDMRYELGREPGVVAADILRIRVTTATAINMLCYIIYEE